MNRINFIVSTMFLMLLAILITGCPKIVPGSASYKPLPKWETKFFAEAKQDIFPNDVRNNPNSHKKTLVVWTGILKKIDFFNDNSSRVARLTVEHHYFDWIEDFSIQRERFFLSPKGEGFFAAAWRVDSKEDQDFVRQFHIGDMVIAYGYPSIIRDGIVGLFPTENLRGIKPEWFRTDVLEYGRPGEPSKLLKTPF